MKIIFRRQLLLTLSCMLSGLAAHISLPAQSEIWQQLNGPYGLHCQSLVSGPNGLLAGLAEGGVLYTAQADGSEPMIIHDRDDHRLLGVTPDSEVIAYESSRQHFRRSTDRGQSWEYYKAPSLRAAALNPEGILFGVTTEGGILRSSDGGQRWERIRPDLSLLRSTSTLHVDAKENLAIIINRRSLYFSSRDSDEWKEPTGLTEPRSQYSIRISAMLENGDVVYHVHDASWHCSRQSLTARQLQSEHQSSSLTLMAAGPNNSLYSASNIDTKLFRLIDGAAPRWEELHFACPLGWISAMTVTIEGKLIVACRRSNSLLMIDPDSGAASALHEGLSALPVSDLALTSEGTLLLAHGQSLTSSAENVNDWREFPIMQGLSGELTSIRSAGESGLFASSIDGVFHLADSESHWENIHSFQGAFGDISFHSSGHNERIFINAHNEALLLYNSVDIYNTNDKQLRSLIQSPASSISRGINGDLLLCTSSGLRRSLDEGRTWSGFGSLNINYRDVVQFSTNELIAVTDFGLLLSIDASSSWTKPTQSETFFPRTLLRLDDSCALACGDFSVHITTDRGRSWRICSPDFSPARLQSLCRIGDHLYVATGGRGLYRTTLKDLADEFGCRYDSVDDPADPDDPPAMVGFSLAPNPVADIAQISLQLIESARADLTIYDASGRLISSQHYGELSPGVHALPLDLSALAQGSYYAACRIGDTFHMTRQIVIVR